MLTRAAIGAFCATALISGGVAPVMASYADHDHGDKDKDVVKVVVCKKVKDKGKDEHKDKDKEFDFEAYTDKDSEYFTLKDGYCKKFELKFKDNKLTVKEDTPKNYVVKDIDVKGDEDGYKVDDSKVRVKIDDKADKPKIKIKFVNKKEKDKEHH